MLLIFVTAIVAIATAFFGLPAYITSIITIFSLAFVAIKELVGEVIADEEKAEKEMTDEKITHIDEELLKRTEGLEKEKKMLEDKQKIIADFIKNGIIKEDSIIKNLNQESFVILYHYNIALPKKYLGLLPNEKSAIKNIIDKLGFVSVGRKYGSYFFHIINTSSLPKELRQPAYLEAYIRKKVIRSWKIIEDQIKDTDREEFKKIKERRLNLVYLLGKVFCSELVIGYLNYPLFSEDFLPYLASFTKKIKDVDKQKLHALISQASLHYFVESITPKDRDKILAKEDEIKKKLGVKSLFDYQGVSKEQWLSVTSGLFESPKSQEYAELIYSSINRSLPIIKEIAQVA